MKRLGHVVRILRPHQWAKNGLVMLPLLVASSVPTVAQLWAAVQATVAFSLCASAGYVFNDLRDVEADRVHVTKRARPFASGALPLSAGPPLIVGLLVVSFGIAAWSLPPIFSGMLALYLVGSLSYSMVFKSKVIVDVIVLASLYTHRVLSGGVATDVKISAWLLAFAMFMFCSLAFVKRYVELKMASHAGRLINRGYRTGDLEMVASMGPTSGYLAVLVFCLYIHDPVVIARYDVPWVLWFVAPVVLYWISRIWVLAHRGEMQEDAVKFALHDWRSWVCLLVVAVTIILARTAALNSIF
jgi:4-hydroxybenzoate polyprenyltransferase